MFELRTKLVAYTILVVLAVAGGLSTISIALDHKNSVAAFERKVTALARTLGEAVVESVYDLDIKLLRQQVTSVLTNNDAKTAFILDAEGLVLTDGMEENPLRGSRIVDPFANRILTEKAWSAQHQDERILVGGPILLTEGVVLGFVYLDFSTAELNARMIGQIQQTLMLSALFVLITSFIAIAVARQITRPINKLTDFAVRVKEGSSDREVPDCGKDEVGRLAQSFSSMLMNLDKSNQDLRKLTETLEERVRDRTQEAEAGTKAKSEFLATMSHEIRTPMNGVLGMTSLLEETNLDEEQELFVRTISESGQALLVIINDILDFSKIEAGKILLDEEPFNLENLVQSILKLLSQKASGKNLNLVMDYSPDMPKVLVGDEGRIRQIITNLIGNSEKFTMNGSIRVVVSGSSAQGASSVEIAVQDTGIGIPESKLAKIFEGFSQVNASSTRKFGGTGLGLTIASDLASLMGGDIQVRSEVGKGSTFTFRCLLKTSNNAEPSLQVTENNFNDLINLDLTKAPLKILIADDNKTNRLVVQKMLKTTGTEVIFAQDGSEAVQQFINHIPGLVFMDISMPKLTGIEATKEIRSFEAENGMNACPIIALTAHAMKGDREKFLEQGMDGYISKPVRKDELIELVAFWSRERDSRQNLECNSA
ncbi:MAG: response regulator [Rhodobacteraceae bacterium]|nr:response regulator [Paracoccaceae bacterium]